MKERLQRKAPERYQDFSDKEKNKSKNMDTNDVKLSSMMQNKGFLSIEKDTMKCKKK